MKSYAAIIGFLFVYVFPRSSATPAFGLGLHLLNKGKLYSNPTGVGSHDDIEDYDGYTTYGLRSSVPDTDEGVAGNDKVVADPAKQAPGGVDPAIRNNAGQELRGLGSMLGKFEHLFGKFGSAHVNTVGQGIGGIGTNFPSHPSPPGADGGMNKYVNQFGQLLPMGSNGRPNSLLGNSGNLEFSTDVPANMNTGMGTFGGILSSKNPPESHDSLTDDYLPSSVTDDEYSGAKGIKIKILEFKLAKCRRANAMLAKALASKFPPLQGNIA